MRYWRALGFNVWFLIRSRHTATALSLRLLLEGTCFPISPFLVAFEHHFLRQISIVCKKRAAISQLVKISYAYKYCRAAPTMRIAVLFPSVVG